MEYKTPVEKRQERAAALQAKRTGAHVAGNEVQPSLQAYANAEEQARAERAQKGVLVRGVSTVGDVVGNVITGALKGVEGILDFGASVVNTIDPFSYIFGYHDEVRDFVEKDFVGDYIDDPLEHLTRYSYTNDGKVGQIIEDVASGVGQMLPAVGVALLTGGTSLAASGASVLGMTLPQAASLGTMAVSAAGNATEQAYAEGAGDVAGLLYGTASGAVEMATEKLTGGVGGIGALTGRGWLNGIAKSTVREGAEAVAKTGLKRVAIDALGEAGEEVIAELANPALKTIYKGRDALGEYGDADYWRGVGHAGIVGGLTSAAYGGTVGRLTKTSGKYADAASVLEKIGDIDAEVKEMKSKGPITEEIANRVDKSKLTNLRMLESTLKAANEKQRADIIKKNGLSGLFAADGSLDADYAAALSTKSQFNRNAVSENMRGREKVIEADLAKTNADLGLEGDTALTVFDGKLTAEEQNKYGKVQQVVEAFNKLSGADTALILLNPNDKINGNITPDSGRVYLSADNLTSDKWAGTIVHEFTHFAEGSAEYDALVGTLEADGALSEAAHKAVEGKGYFVDADKIADIKARMDAGEEVRSDERVAYLLYASEKSAHMTEILLGNESFIDRVVRSHGSVAEKMLGKIKAMQEAFANIRHPDAQAQQKRLAKAERMYLDAIEAAGKRYVNGKIVSVDDEEEKENTAEGGGKYSLCSFDDGKRFVKVDIDQELFDGLTTKEKTDLATKILKERFQGKVVGTENRAFVNGATVDEYTHPSKHNIDTSVYEAKMQASAELDNLMDAGFNFRNEADGKYGHNHPRAIGGYDYFDVIFQVGDEYYQGLINIENNKRGKRLKDITKIKSITEDMTSQYGENPSYAFLRNASITSISQNSEKSTPKAKFSLKDPAEVENRRRLAAEKFGFTNDVECAGFVLPDGRMLNLSQYGLKGVQHKRIEAVFEDLKGDDAINQFMQDGNVRLKASSPGIEIGEGGGITTSQRNTIRRFIDTCLARNDRFFLDITAEDGSDIASVEYDGDTSASDILYDIEKYYERGRIPEEKQYNDFRYSLKDGDPAKRVQPLSAEEMIENAMARGMGVNSQTSVKDDGKKGAEAKATKRPASYAKEEARAMVDKILEITSYDGTRAKLVGGDHSAVIKRAHALLNSTEAGKRGGVALDFADYVIERAVLMNDVDPVAAEYYTERVDLLKPYLHRLDMRGLEGEIGHLYGKDTSVYARWGKKKNDVGISVEEMAADLVRRGYQISAENDADILFEVDRDYREAVAALRRGVNATVRDAVTKQERKELRQSIAKAVLNSFDNRDFSRATLTKIADRYMAEADRYREANKKLARENRRLKKDLGRTTAEKDRAEARIEKETTKRKEAEAFGKVKDRVLKMVKDITNWKKGVFESAAEANGDAFKGVIGQLSRIENKGSVSATGTRKAMKAIAEWYARPDKHPMVKALQESDFYDENVLDTMNEIGSDEKIERNEVLTTAELSNVELVVRHFKHVVEDYNCAFKNGKYVEARPLVENFIKIAEENAKIKTVFGTKVMESKFYRYFGDVESIMKWADRHNEDGFFTTTFRELREGAYRMAVAQMEMRRDLDEWLDKKENRKFLEDINERTVEVRGLTMTVAEAMSLYMTAKREQAQGGILDSGFSVRDRKTGELRSVEGLLRAEIEAGEEIDLLAAQKAMIGLREELWSGFSEKEQTYISMAEKILNEDCKLRKGKTDEIRLGYSNVSEDYYFPVRRGHIAQKVGEDTLGGEVERIKSLSFNKSIVQGAKGKLYIEPVNNVLDRHIAGIALYENISIPIDNFNRMFNMDVSGNRNDPKTIATITSGEGGWADAKSYIDKLIKDIEGIRSEDKWASETLSFIRSGFVKFQLGANPKTWTTQFSSLFASMSMVDPQYLAKAFTMKVNEAELDKYSPLAKLRNSENTAAIAQGVVDKVGRLGDALMAPIGWTDRLVIKKLWSACQLQVEAEQKLAVGTEENKLAAGKMLEKVIFETQQNSLLTERSAAMRSSNEIIKGFTMFSADGMKVTGRVLDAFGKVSVLKARIKTAEGAQKTALEADLKTATKAFRRASASMVSTAIYMSLVALVFSHLYGKKDEDETPAEAAKTFFGDFVGNLFGGLPLIRDIYSYLVDGYELNNYAISSLNDLLSGATGLISLADDLMSGREVTKQQIATKAKAALFGAGQLFGVPLRNAYNVGRGVTGLAGLIAGRDLGYALDSVFYDKSYKSDLQKALDKGDERKVTMIADLMVNESLGVVEPKTRDAIKALVGKGYDVLPRSVGDSVTYDGEAYAFTARSRKRFEEVYGIADEAVADLVSMSKFSSADAEVQAKAIRFIYDTYYNLALEDFLGVSIENKNVLFAQAVDIEKLALIVATARSIEGDKDASGKTVSGSRKAKVMRYIESLNMSAAEKYMIAGYLGYKNANGEAAVRRYINKLSLTKAEKEQLLSYSGYAA